MVACVTGTERLKRCTGVFSPGGLQICGERDPSLSALRIAQAVHGSGVSSASAARASAAHAETGGSVSGELGDAASASCGAGLRRRSPATKLVDQWAGLEREDGGAWEESWNGIPDNKPKGPEGVALDVSFPGYGTLYGLPEHASPLSLRSTRAPPRGEEEEEGRYSDPYRLMNTDVFEYNYDSPMSLYGSAPILHAQSRGSSVAVLWMNAAETWIDLHKTRRRPGPRLPHTGVGAPTSTSQEDKSAWSGGSSKLSSHAHFFSESGVLDMFVFLGPTATRNMERYTSLVGRTALPQYFALAYHLSLIHI